MHILTLLGTSLLDRKLFENCSAERLKLKVGTREAQIIQRKCVITAYRNKGFLFNFCIFATTSPHNIVTVVQSHEPEANVYAQILEREKNRSTRRKNLGAKQRLLRKLLRKPAQGSVVRRVNSAIHRIVIFFKLSKHV